MKFYNSYLLVFSTICLLFTLEITTRYFSWKVKFSVEDETQTKETLSYSLYSQSSFSQAFFLSRYLWTSTRYSHEHDVSTALIYFLLYCKRNKASSSFINQIVSFAKKKDFSPFVFLIEKNWRYWICGADIIYKCVLNINSTLTIFSYHLLRSVHRVG